MNPIDKREMRTTDCDQNPNILCLYTILGRLVIFYYIDWVKHHTNIYVLQLFYLIQSSSLLPVLIQSSCNLQSSVCSCQGILVIKLHVLIKSTVLSVFAPINSVCLVTCLSPKLQHVTVLKEEWYRSK